MSDQSQPMAYTSMIKFTVDGRPSIENINQLFSSMIAQITPATHRYMFRSYINSFSSEDAIHQLESLKFSKREDNSRLSSFTITTFNMEKHMAKALIQQFLWTRLIESAIDPNSRTYRDKGIWRVRSKGLCILQEFCEKTKMDHSVFKKHINSAAIPMYLINLERIKHNDRINCSRRYISYLFTIMLSSLFSENNESLTLAYPETHCFSEISGTSSVHSSDSSFVEISSQCLNRNLTITDLFPDVHILPNSLLVDDENELYSQQHQTLVSNVVFLLPNVLKTSITFSSLLCCNWLLNFSTVSSTDEAEVIMSELLKLGWIKFLDSKHSHLHCVESSKTLTLKLTDIGVKVAKDVSLSQYIAMKSAMFSCKSSLNMSTSDIALSISETNSRILEKEPQETFTPPLTPTFSIIESKESNAFKLKMVLKSPVLRPLFRNFLMANFCQENLDFWIDYDNLRRRCQNHALIPTANQRQLLEDAYILWNSYLRPGAVCELNIEHALREDMAEEMSHIVTVIHEPLNNTPRVVVSTYSTYQSLSILIKWFDKINEQICKLMSTDSIPKFVTTSKYKNALKSIQSFPVLPE